MSGSSCPVIASSLLRTVIGCSARMVIRASNNWEGLRGLVIWAAKMELSGPISLRPKEENSIKGRVGFWERISRASITPSISGICISRIATSKGSPRLIHSSASRGERVSRAIMPHDRVCSTRMRRLVSLSSTASIRLPANWGWLRQQFLTRDHGHGHRLCLDGEIKRGPLPRHALRFRPTISRPSSR